MRSALYVRVSTAEQVSEGYSLDAQERKLTEYANFQKYTVAGVFRDEGFSAASMSRPALAQLLDMVTKKKVDIVLIYKLDRLSRRVKDVLEIVELFEKHSVTLFSLTENIDVSSPFGRAALKMSATFSELERETIKERMMLGKDQRVKQGKMLGAGRAAFGYKLDGGIFKAVSEEAEIVKKIFDLYLQGYSSRKICDYGKERYGNPLFDNPPLVMRLLKRSAYAGYFDWKGETYKAANIEPIIGYDVFLKAQKQLEKNRTARERNNTPYLLTGLVICTQCGNRYVGTLKMRSNALSDGKQSKIYKTQYYGCANRIKADRNYKKGSNCTNEIFNAAALEAEIEKRTKNLKFDSFTDCEYTSQFVDELAAENFRLKEKNSKLLDLYLDGGMEKSVYQMRAAEIEKVIAKNKIVIESETNKVELAPTLSIDYLLEAQKNYDTLNKKEKRRFLQGLIRYIAVDNEKIVIKWRVY